MAWWSPRRSWRGVAARGGASQKQILTAARDRRPVVVATQMLESMTASPADAAGFNVATAAGGVVMLSAKSQRAPILSKPSATMDRVARQVESHRKLRRHSSLPQDQVPADDGERHQRSRGVRRGNAQAQGHCLLHRNDGDAGRPSAAPADPGATHVKETARRPCCFSGGCTASDHGPGEHSANSWKRSCNEQELRGRWRPRHSLRRRPLKRPGTTNMLRTSSKSAQN